MDKNQETIDAVSSVIRDLFGKIGLDISEISTKTLESSQENNEENMFIFRVISNDDCSLILGKRGENLKSFEHIVRILSTKKLNKKVLISVDLNDYKKDRFDKVLRIAKEVAEKVKSTKRAEALIPMPAYERRLIHLELAAYGDIATESIGEEPQRRVVIRPYP